MTNNPFENNSFEPSNNPYAAPVSQPQIVGIQGGGNRRDLKAVAVYQKGLILCIFLYLIVVAAQFAIPPNLRPFLALIALPVVLAGVVFVFLLALKAYHPVVGILLGIGALIPCLGIIFLLIVNAKATEILKQNGIKVGFFGARLSDLGQ